MVTIDDQNWIEVFSKLIANCVCEYVFYWCMHQLWNNSNESAKYCLHFCLRKYKYRQTEPLFLILEQEYIKITRTRQHSHLFMTFSFSVVNAVDCDWRHVQIKTHPVVYSHLQHWWTRCCAWHRKCKCRNGRESPFHLNVTSLHKQCRGSETALRGNCYFDMTGS